MTILVIILLIFLVLSAVMLVMSKCAQVLLELILKMIDSLTSR